MKGNTVKVLIAGSRYTGKGQIGREWGKTDADLPTLQPVILYDRHVVQGDERFRVVAWVLSYDPEFADIRAAFFQGADGIVFTYDITEDQGASLLALDDYAGELQHLLGPRLPAVLVGVRLDGGKAISAHARALGARWAGRHGIPVIEADFSDKQQFTGAVEAAFSIITHVVLSLNVGREREVPG